MGEFTREDFKKLAARIAFRMERLGLNPGETEISQPERKQEEHFLYSKEGWEEHQRMVREFLQKIKAGTVHLRFAYLSNPIYGSYSYYEGVRISGSVDYADPAEILEIAEMGGLKKVSLAGRWWTQVGLEGYGQEISVKEAKARLPEWKSIFAGRAKID